MPLYGGSIGGGYSDALAAMSQQDLQRQQLMQMQYQLAQQQRLDSLRGPAGQLLTRWGQQQQVPAPQGMTPMPQAPQGGIMPQGQPPPPAMAAGPGVSQGLGGAPQPAPIKPWTAVPQPGAGPQQQPDAVPRPAAGQQTGQPDQYGDTHALLNTPSAMQMIKLMDQMGVPMDKRIDIMGMIQPVFGAELKAAIASHKAAEDTYRNITRAEREKTYATDVASKVVDRQNRSDETALRDSQKAEGDADKRAETKRFHEEMVKRWEKQDKIAQGRLKVYQAMGKEAHLANNVDYQVALHEYEAAERGYNAIGNSLRTPNLSAEQVAALQQQERDTLKRLSTAISNIESFKSAGSKTAPLPGGQNSALPGGAQPKARTYNPATGKIE